MPNSPDLPTALPAPLEGRYLDTAAAALLLACSRRTVVRLIRDGWLPAVRLGPSPSSFRIHEPDLLAFLTAYRTGFPATESGQEA